MYYLNDHVVYNTLHMSVLLVICIMQQARRQEFPEGGSAGGGGCLRPPETLGYLVQNPAI